MVVFLEGGLDNKQALIQNPRWRMSRAVAEARERRGSPPGRLRCETTVSFTQPSSLLEAATAIPLHSSRVEVGWRPSSD